MQEIDDNELTQLRGAKRLLDTLQTGKTKREFDKLVKVHHPEYAPTVQREEIDEIEKNAVAAAKKIWDDERAAERKEKAEKAFQDQINALRLSKDNPDGYTDEGVQEIIKIMKERTIPDVEAARLVFEKQNPAKPEPPAGFAGTSWNFGAPKNADENLKLLYSDPDAWADQEAIKVVNEARRGQFTE